MADAISIQELIDARTDAKTLEEAVNGDAVTTVLSRLGETYPTLSNALNQIDSKLDSADAQIKQAITDLFENGGLPATPFATKALVVASALPDGSYAMVTEDTEANNGLYVKTAGSWVKSAYDPTALANTYTDTSVAAESYKTWGSFDISAATGLKGYFTSSFINNSGGVSHSQAYPNLTASVFREIDTSAASIVINGYSSSSSTIKSYAFFDVTKTLISIESGSGASGNVEITIAKASIPDNAKYIRYTGQAGVSNSITGVLPLTPTTTSTQAIVYDVLPKSNVDALLSFSNTNNESKVAHFINATGVEIPSSNNTNLLASAYLTIDRTAETLEIKGRGQGIIYLYALYDENKNVLTASTGANIGIQTLTLAISSLPSNAFYVRYTGELGEDTYIKGVSYPSILDALRDEFLPDKKLSTLFITGASFAYSSNTWFGSANNMLGTVGVNKARGGAGSPTNDAELFWRDTFITDAEFEAIDVFSFQYANVKGLDSTEGLKASASEYTATFSLDETGNPFTVYSTAQAMDYVLKLLQERCYTQKDNPNSKWFGTQHGKPFRVLFVTSWHDSRPYYNIPIRTLADRWGAGVCEFDRKIGFNSNTPLPDGKQVSTLYAQDTEVIGGVTYGWHPKRGASSEYIQNRMAEIYAASIKEWFL